MKYDLFRLEFVLKVDVYTQLINQDWDVVEQFDDLMDMIPIQSAIYEELRLSFKEDK